MNLLRILLPLILALTALIAACGDDDGGAQSPAATRRPDHTPIPMLTQREFPVNTPEARTPYPGVALGYRSFDGQEPLPQLPEGAAVYLSLGDSLNWGCCDDPEFSSHPRFAHWLSERLNREVVWVSLAGNGTLRSFLKGEPGASRPQLDVAEEVIADLRAGGHDVVAITLSIGGNDFLELRTNLGCGGVPRPECQEAFTQILLDYPGKMQEVYARLNAAKDPATPVFQNNYYDALNCGLPGDDISVSAVSMSIFNETILAATLTGGAFPLDFETAFKGHACEYISGVDPTYAGYDVMLDLDIAAYEALPAAYVEPWER
ncbi:MAG: SGNH/GDSL hydrolase family protein [Dehalococcoidia bacterium]